jgi:hypothetical protein
MSCDSDDDLATVLAEATAATRDSDDDLAAVCAEASSLAPVARFAYRSGLLTRHMRAMRACNVTARAVVIAPHVQARIERANEQYAVRGHDVIDPSEKKPAKVKGRGKYRHWVPPAVLRVCWGLRPPRPRHPVRRLSKKQPLHRSITPTVTSTNTFALLNFSGGTHVQQVRNAMAQHFLDLQVAAFRQLPVCDVMFLELAIDETEVDSRQDLRSERCPMVVLHARVARYGTHQQPVMLELVIPSAMVLSTSSNALLAVILQRMPLSFQELRRTARSVVLILNSDSARSCVKLARHLGTSLPTIHAPCRMHQLCIAMVATLRMSGLMSAMFCAAHLFRRKRVQTLMRKQLRKYIDENLEISFASEADPGACAQVAGVMQLMSEVLGQSERENIMEPAVRTQRVKAWQRLSKFFAGPVRGEKRIKHRCVLGCHESKQSAADELYNDVVEVFLNHPPPIPAWNKWTKIHPPVAWFTTFCCLHFILPGSIEGLTTLLPEDDFLNVVGDAQAVGMEDEISFRCQEQARFRKTSVWLNAAATPDKLVSVCLAIRVALRVMGNFFKSAGRYVPSPAMSVFPLLLNTSPAKAAIEFCLAVLSDEAHETWHPLVSAGRAWSETLYVAASAPMLVLAGQLFRRFIAALQGWPWRMGLVLSDDLDAASKLAVAEDLFRCNACDLDPFTAWVKSKWTRPTDMLSDAGLDFVRALFRHVPATNIHSEDRFSRVARRAACLPSVVFVLCIVCAYFLPSVVFVLLSRSTQASVHARMIPVVFVLCIVYV